MKKILMLFSGFIVTSQFFWSPSSFAQSNFLGGVFVEPTVTYEPGDTKVNYPAPLSDSSGSATGFGVGARLGVHANEAIFAGLDGRFSMPNFKDSSVNYDAPAKAGNLGAVVGVQMPDIGLRVWGTYVFAAALDPNASSNVDVKFQDGRGYRAGAGFRIKSVSANVEYQQLTYGKSTLEKAGPFAPGTSFGNVNLDNNTWVAGISFPIEL